MVKISDELKIRITPELDTSNSKFQNQLKSLLSGNEAPKIELTVSKINGTAAISKFKKELESAIGKININAGAGDGLKRSLKVGGSSKNEWQSIFKESIKAQTAKNVDLKPLNEQLRREEIEAQKAAKQIEVAAKRLETQKTKLQQSYAKLFDSDSYTTKVQGLKHTASSLSSGNAEEVQKAKELKAELLEVERIAAEIQGKAGVNGENIVNLDVSEVKSLEGNFKQLNLEIQKTENISKSGLGISSELSKAAVQANRLQKLINETNNWLTRNDRAKGTGSYNNIKSYIAEAEKLKAMADNGVAVDPAQVDRLAASIKVADAEIVKMGKDGETYGTKLSNQMEKLGVYFSASAIIMGAWRQVKNMIQNVTELDAAMTELKKVTDETNSTYATFLNNAETRAKSLGVTLTDTVRATADFARLGFGLEDAETISDAALVYKNVGDGIDNISESSESIISTMKAFNVEAEDAMSIVDRFNITGNNFAISSKGVGDALQRSASALATAGNSIDESIALIVAANEVVQDPDVVGTALKTSALRLTSSRGELEALGEDVDGAAESVTKLQTQLLNLTKGKVDIMLDEDTFKSTYQILLEMSQVWDSMTQKDRLDALELMFGKRGANVGSSIMENMGTAQKALDTSMNSAGSAMAENEVVLDSIAGKANQFKAQFEALSNSVINSELVKGTFDAGSGILEFITQLVDNMGLLPPLFTAAGAAITGFKNKGLLKFDESGEGVLGKLFTKSGVDVDVINRYNEEFDKTGNYIKAVNAATTDGNGNLVSYSKTTGELIKNANGAKVSQESLSAAVKTSGTSFRLASVGAKVLQVALNSLISLGIGLAIQGIITAISNIANASQETAQRAKEATQAYDESLSSLDSYKSRVQSLQDALSSGTLSFDETKQKRLELMQIQDELIDKYGSEASSIDTVTSAIKGQDEAWDKLAQRDFLKWEAEVSDVSFWSRLNLFGYQKNGFLSGSSALDEAKHFMEEAQEYDLNPFGELAGKSASLDELLDVLNDARKSIREEFSDYISEGVSGDILTGTPDELLDVIPKIKQRYSDLYQEVLSDLNLPQEQIDDILSSPFESLDDTIAKIATGLEKHEDTYRHYLDGFIKYHSAYQDEYKDFVNSKDQYDTAMAKGNKEAIAESETQLREVYTKIMESTADNPVIRRYFETLFPDLGDLIKKWNFGDALSSKNLTSGLQKLNSSDLFNQIFDGNISEEFQSVIDIARELGLISDTTTDSIFNLIGMLTEMGLVVEDTAPQIEQYAERIQGYQKQLQDVTSAEEAFSKALDEQEKQGVVSAETLSELVNINSAYADCLEDSNGRLVLNAEKFRDVNQEILESSRVQTDATLAQAIWQRALGGSNDELDEQITQLLLLSEQYDYATGKLKAWRDAQNGPDKGDLYGEGANAFDALVDGIKNSDVGTNKFNAASALLIPQDVLDQGLESVEQYMSNLRLYFADENDAIQLGWDQLVEKGLATYDELNGYQLKPDVDKEDIEESLHMTEDMVQMWIDLNEKKGAKFDFGDESILEAKDALIGLVEAKQEISTTSTSVAPNAEELERLSEASDRAKEYINFLKELPESVLTKLNLQVNEDGELALLDDPEKVITVESDIKPLIDKFGIVSVKEDELEKSTPTVTPEVNTAPAMVGIGTIETALSNLTSSIRYIDVVVRKTQENGSSPDSGTPPSNGKSGLGGNAFAQGSISAVRGTKKALVGEEAPEMHVSRQGGKWELVGQNGAEFIDVQPGDIIFNAQQTKYLLTHGFTNTRGKALVNGTSGDAFLSGGIKPYVPTYDWSDWKNDLPYNNSTSSSGNKTSSVSEAKDDVEEYISTLWQLYEVEKKLQDIQNNKELLEAQLDVTDNLVEQIKLREKIIGTYKEEQAAQHNLNEARRALINDKIAELRKQGFDISYDAKNNDVFIRNTEHINDLIGDTTEETNDLRKEAEDAIDTINEWNDANRDGSKAWYELKQAAKEAKEEIVDSSLKIYDNFIDYNDSFDLWTSSGTTKVKALTERMKVLDQLYAKGYLTAEKYRELSDDNAKDIYDAQKDALEEIVKLTEQMIKQEVEDKVDALEEQKRLYKEIIDLKKEALKIDKDETDHQDELSEKMAELAKMKTRIDKLALAANAGDKSAAAEKASLDEDYAKLQKELVDFQTDYAYDERIKALDKEQEAFDKSKDKEIKDLKESIDTEVKLYNEAIARINSSWQQTYDDLIAWNKQYGDGISGDDSITSSWNEATEAVKKYGYNVEEALRKSKTEYSTGEKAGITNDPANTAQVKALALQMHTNSDEWVATKDAARKKKLADENASLAKQIEKLTTRKLVRGYDGVWYFDNVGGQKLYDKYHSGGVVGDQPKAKSNELFALLKKGELVLTEPQQQTLISMISAPITQLAKLKSTESTLPASNIGQSQISINMPFDFTVEHEGDFNESDFERYADIMTGRVYNNLNKAFVSSGVSNINFSSFKP